MAEPILPELSVVGCADPRLSGALTKPGEWRLP